MIVVDFMRICGKNADWLIFVNHWRGLRKEAEKRNNQDGEINM